MNRPETIDEKLDRVPKNLHIRRYYKPRDSYRFEEYYLRCSWERTDVTLSYENLRGGNPLISVLGQTFSLAVDAMIEKVNELNLHEGEAVYCGL